MKKIIYRKQAPQRFFLYKSEDECDDLEKELADFQKEHPGWDMLIFESTDWNTNTVNFEREPE
jgi:hypothetical protein